MLNRIVLMGRLTRDPELRKTQSDTPVCSFSLAVDRDYKKDGEKKETDFIDIVAWRATAGICEQILHERPHGRCGRPPSRSAIGRIRRATSAAARRSSPTMCILATPSRKMAAMYPPMRENPAQGSARRPALYTELWRREWRTAILRKMEREGRLPSLPHIHIRRRIKYAKLCYL